MSLSLYKIRTYTNKIDITAVGAKIKDIATKGEEFGCVGVDFFLIDAHLILSDFDAPLLNDVTDELHPLVLEHLLRHLLIEVIIIQYLLQQLGVDVRPLTLYHLK